MLGFMITPIGSIITGILFTLLITGFVWWDSKDKKFTLITFAAGALITIGGVVYLYFTGSYS